MSLDYSKDSSLRIVDRFKSSKKEISKSTRRRSYSLWQNTEDKSFEFAVVSRSRTLVLRASSRSAQVSWMREIRSTIDEEKEERLSVVISSFSRPEVEQPKPSRKNSWQRMFHENTPSEQLTDVEIPGTLYATESYCGNLMRPLNSCTTQHGDDLVPKERTRDLGKLQVTESLYIPLLTFDVPIAYLKHVSLCLRSKMDGIKANLERLSDDLQDSVEVTIHSQLMKYQDMMDSYKECIDFYHAQRDCMRCATADMPHENGYMYHSVVNRKNKRIYFKKSVNKTRPIWRFVATNLNHHLLTVRRETNDTNQSEYSGKEFWETTTCGVPAHQCKIFSTLPQWHDNISRESMESIPKVFACNPEEDERKDVICSQLLSVIVSSIIGILQLAERNSTRHLDTISMWDSIKIGSLQRNKEHLETVPARHLINIESLLTSKVRNEMSLGCKMGKINLKTSIMKLREKRLLC